MAKYTIEPLEHLLSLERPSLHMFPGAADWPSKNLTIDQKRLKKRPGYLEDRNIETKVQSIHLFQGATTRNTMILTDADLILREAGSTSAKWSYKTAEYATGTISDISGTNVTGLGSTFTSAMEGDYFVLNKDLDADEEPDSSWREISTVGGGTALKLATAYESNVSSTSLSYHIRRVYTTPANERWQTAVVNDKFCFVNGHTNGQYWSGTGYAADLDSTYVQKAKYCIEYGYRLCVAGHYDPTLATPAYTPWTLRCSANGDPEDYVDSTAQDYLFEDTEEIITGMGKVGSNLLVYKSNSFYIGYKTGAPNDPFKFPSHKKGKGLYAPYSLVHAMGTNLFLGNDDFYIIEGDEAQPIGERIRHQFFSIVGETEAQNTWGFYNANEKEVVWFAETSEGRFAFVFDIKDKEWGAYFFGDNMTGAGKGAI